MIDLRAKREELINSVNTCQETIVKSRDNINFLNGAITLLNELIADQDAQAAAKGESHEDPPQTP